MDVVPGVILLALLFFGLGLANIFASDWSWGMAQWQNSMLGRNSERTVVWERWRVFGGVMSLCFGAALLFMAFKAIEVNNLRDADQRQQETVNRLDSDFRDIIPVLQANATSEPQEADGGGWGLTDAETSTLIYGTCPGSDRFYLLILDHWDGLGDVAYSTDTTPCLPPDLYRLSSSEQALGESVFGGYWIQL